MRALVLGLGFDTHSLSLFLSCVCLGAFVSYYCTQTHSVSHSLGYSGSKRLFLKFLGGFELEEPAGPPFLKKVFKGKKLVPLFPIFSLYFYIS